MREFSDSHYVFDRVLSRRGGAWVDATRSFVDSSGHMGLGGRESIRRNLAMITVNLPLSEPSQDDMRAHRAFVQGYEHQEEIIQVIYGNQIHTNERLFSSFDILVKQTFDDIMQKSQENLTNLKSPARYNFTVNQIGSIGINALGYHATSYIDEWGSDIYPQRDELAMAYKTGHGALAFTAIMLQQKINRAVLLGSDREERDRTTGLED